MGRDAWPRHWKTMLMIIMVSTDVFKNTTTLEACSKGGCCEKVSGAMWFENRERHCVPTSTAFMRNRRKSNTWILGISRLMVFQMRVEISKVVRDAKEDSKCFREKELSQELVDSMQSKMEFEASDCKTHVVQEKFRRQFPTLEDCPEPWKNTNFRKVLVEDNAGVLLDPPVLLPCCLHPTRRKF